MISFFSLLAAVALAEAPVDTQLCINDRIQNIEYVVCHFAGDDDVRLFLNDENDAPFGHFTKVKNALTAKGEALVFAMNGGMYHEDRSPVGLYVEDGVERASLNTNDGPGNFHLKPNGVFWIRTDPGTKAIGVSISEALEKDDAPGVIRYATQSGPMLVINNEIHPRFLPDSDSRKRRNGVGVTEGGEIFFVLADTPVNFYDFAAYFREVLKTPNALYLDGTISRIYAPDLDRNDPGAAMGPIIGVVKQHD